VWQALDPDVTRARLLRSATLLAHPEGNSAENRKVGGSIPSLPITVQAKSGLSALTKAKVSKWTDQAVM
jgi:hypothetical protein